MNNILSINPESLLPENASLVMQTKDTKIYTYDDNECIIPCTYVLTIKEENNKQKFVLLRVNKKTGANTIVLTDNDFSSFLENLKICDVCLSDKSYEIERIVDDYDSNEKRIFVRYYSINSKATLRMKIVINTENNALKDIQIYPLVR